MHIWKILDGKPGHENQTHGLCAALQLHFPDIKFFTHEINANSKLNSYQQWALKRFPQGKSLPKPELIIGTGHRTHPAILAAKRCYGGYSVVLMKPSLPVSLFDFCIAPEHDPLSNNERVLLTKGVINTVQKPHKTKGNNTLILIGGPSQHVTWSDDKIIDQIQNIANNTHRKIILSTSRRTPASFVKALQKLSQLAIEIYFAEDTPANWLNQQLENTQEAWVSADSVSMIYETLTAGIAVGVLELDMNLDSRVISGLTELNKENSITFFSAWQKHRQLQPPQNNFNEAERSARWLMAQLKRLKSS